MASIPFVGGNSHIVCPHCGCEDDETDELCRCDCHSQTASEARTVRLVKEAALNGMANINIKTRRN